MGQPAEHDAQAVNQSEQRQDLSRTGASGRRYVQGWVLESRARASVPFELQPVEGRKIVGTANHRLRTLHTGPKRTPAHTLGEGDPAAKSVGNPGATWAAVDGYVVAGGAKWGIGITGMPVIGGSPLFGAGCDWLKILWGLVA